MLKLPPPLLMTLIGIAMFVADRATPQFRFNPNLFFDWAWVASLVFGLAINAAGFMTLRRAKTTIDPIHPSRVTQFVSTGIFSFSRNPMYVGFLALLVAFAFWITNPIGAMGPIIFYGYISGFQIPREEVALSEKFGERYREYMERVPRWIW